MSKFKKGIILNVSSDLGIIAPDQRIYKKNNFIKPITYSVVKFNLPYQNRPGITCPVSA